MNHHSHRIGTQGHPSAPTLLALSNDSSLLASYSPYPNTLLCHTRSSGTHFTLNFKPARSVTCIAFSPTRKTLLAAGTSAGGVHLFDTSKPGSPLRTWGDMHTGKVMAVAFAPIKAQLMISAGMDGVVKVTDLDRQM